MSQRKASTSSKLVAQSKKIQKEPKPEKQKPAKTGKSSPKNYKTFLNVKEVILEEIRYYLELVGVSSSEVYAELCDLDQDDFNFMLNTLIPDYDEDFKAGDIPDLRCWRRKAKNWFKKDGAPDARGAPLVPHQLKESFKDNLKNAFILNEIQDKSFAYLRSKVLEILRLMGVENIQENSCSKRWWYDYLPENKDIEALWEKLPKLSNKTANRREIFGFCTTPEQILNDNASTIAEEGPVYQNVFESSPREEVLTSILFADSPSHNSDHGYGYGYGYEENVQNLQQSPAQNPMSWADSVFEALDYGNFQVPKEPFYASYD